MQEERHFLYRKEDPGTPLQPGAVSTIISNPAQLSAMFAAILRALNKSGICFYRIGTDVCQD